jgi:hypothetical protein
MLSVVPTILEGIILPIILFVLAVKLNPNKPIGAPIKWGFITGTIMISAFWLVNTNIWVSVIRSRGIEYLWNVIVQVDGGQFVTFHPEHLVSFITSAFGLLAIMIYTGYLTTKSTRIAAIQNLRLGSIGIVILGLGLFYLWNYYSWVLFAGDTWNNWYAWILGHNMNLWMLSLPLLGVPLLFANNAEEKKPS